MINKSSLLIVLLLLTMLSSCRVIGAIFNTGMGVGIFITVLVVVMVIFIISKVAGRRK